MGTAFSVFRMDGAVENQTELEAVGAALKELYNDIDVTSMPAGYTVSVSNEVDVRANDTGNLIASLTFTPPSPLTMTGGSYAAGVGSRLRWATDGIKNGRRVVGTTFVVPLTVANYESNGTLIANAVLGQTNAGSTLLGSLNAIGTPLAIWSRPTTQGGSDGALHPVTGVSVPDRVSWLSTRRS